jgi:hypothetical protein
MDELTRYDIERARRLVAETEAMQEAADHRYMRQGVDILRFKLKRDLPPGAYSKLVISLPVWNAIAVKMQIASVWHAFLVWRGHTFYGRHRSKVGA